jgi:hypothetical protein
MSQAWTQWDESETLDMIIFNYSGITYRLRKSLLKTFGHLSLNTFGELGGGRGVRHALATLVLSKSRHS